MRVLQFKFWRVTAAVLLTIAVSASEAQELLYTTDSHLEQLKALATTKGTSQYRAILSLQQKLKNAAPPDPFVLEADTFDFGWCRPPERNKTLKDLSSRLEHQSSFARDMAHLYVYTGNAEALKAAYEMIRAWSEQSTLFNAYDLGMHPEKADFPGKEEGFCNRSWNMMLDSIWQTYGLINFSQVYLTLKKHSKAIALEEEQIAQLEQWLIDDLTTAVNAGFHAWTRWADAHPNSRAYMRYRADNHIAWSLAGLAAAAHATENEELMNYVVIGTPYKGYANPSHLTAFVELAINEQGEVYDEQVRAGQHKGFFYANFSLWATLHTVISAKSFYSAEEDSPHTKAPLASVDAKVLSGFLNYAGRVSSNTKMHDAKEKTDPAFFSFSYKLANNWLTQNKTLCVAADAKEAQHIRQTLGSTSLVTLPCDQQPIENELN